MYLLHSTGGETLAFSSPLLLIWEGGRIFFLDPGKRRGCVISHRGEGGKGGCRLPLLTRERKMELSSLPSATREKRRGRL